MAKHPKKLDRKGRMGFSNKFAEQTPSRSRTESDVRRDAIKALIDEIYAYAEFVRKHTEKLMQLEKKSSEAHFELDGLKDDLETIQGYLRGLKESTNLVSTSKSLEAKLLAAKGHLQSISEIADEVTRRYANVHPEHGKKFAADNNNLLNRVLDRFVSVLNKLASSFGKHEALQRELINDIQAMKAQAKHKIKLE